MLTQLTISFLLLTGNFTCWADLRRFTGRVVERAKFGLQSDDQLWSVGPLIGTGGFGRVYKISDRKNPDNVRAFKVPLDERSSTLAQEERIYRSLATIRPPHLVQFRGTLALSLPRGGSAENRLTHGISMDLVRGKTLRVELDDFYSIHMDPSQTEMARLNFLIRYIGYMKVVLEFLDALHHNGLVAMDLAPPNIMLEDISGSSLKKVVVIDPTGIRSPKMISKMWKKWGDTDLILTSPYYPLQDYADLGITSSFDYYAIGIMLFEACVMSARRPEIYSGFESIKEIVPSLARMKELVSETVLFQNPRLEKETKELLFRFIDSRESRVATNSEVLALLNQWIAQLETEIKTH